MGSTFRASGIEEGATFVIGSWTFASDGKCSLESFLAERPGPYLTTASPPKVLRDLAKNQLSAGSSGSTSTTRSTLLSISTPIGTPQVKSRYNSFPTKEGVVNSELATPSDNPPTRLPFGLSNAAAVYQQMYTAKHDNKTTKTHSRITTSRPNSKPALGPLEDDEDDFTILLSDTPDNVARFTYSTYYKTSINLEGPLVRLPSGLVVTSSPGGLLVHWPGAIPYDARHDNESRLTAAIIEELPYQDGKTASITPSAGSMGDNFSDAQTLQLPSRSNPGRQVYMAGESGQGGA